MKPFLALARIIDGFNGAVALVMQWLTLVMVLLGAYNVITRYVGRAIGVSLGGSIYTVLQTYAFDLVFLLAAGWVLRTGGHVRVDILYSRLGWRGKAWVDIFGTIFFLFPFCYMGFMLSLPYVRRSWQHMEVNVNAGGLPIYLMKTVIPVAFALLALQGISQLIKLIASLRGRGPLAPPAASATPVDGADPARVG